MSEPEVDTHTAGGALGREAILVGALGLGELVGAAIDAWRGGLNGLGLGWLAAVALEALVCGPLVWRAYRGRLVITSGERGTAAEAGQG